jgi:ABC transport system ATP-binding/permease protein
MALITLTQAHLAYGHVALLDHTDFSLEERERVGLVGRNGTGKSSLLKILALLEKPDDGTVQWQRGLRVAYVAQEPSLLATDTIGQAVGRGIQHVQDLINRYTNAGDSDDLDALQSEIESLDGWNWERRVEETLHRLELHPEKSIASLSGGMKKRVALAQALVQRPDVMLLDEPTNHLDLASILWLEDLLKQFEGSLITISHDRDFLDNVVTRTVELDRGKLMGYEGGFTAYQAQKEEQLRQEAVLNAKSDKLLAQEEVWIRKGVEARRTRSQSRIGRLEALRAQRSSRRDVVGRARMEISQGDASGKIVAELDSVSKSFTANDVTQTVVKDFSATLLRGDKIGLIGHNGSGKTTLLKLILGELAPDSGSIRSGTQLQVAYFDQMRDKLDPEATLEDTISPGSEWIEVNERRTHVKSYLSDFLFSPSRAMAPVKSLSGGERNRLLLARLFARPANVLVLDEPTNDLDIETLELLEDLLQDFSGTVFLVSHDRRFLGNVVTSTIVNEGPGEWREYEGDVQDWLTQSARAQAFVATSAAAAPAASNVTSPAMQGRVPGVTASSTPSSAAKRKLSYKEQREHDTLPATIAKLEAEQADLEKILADGALYVDDPTRAAALAARLVEVEETWMSSMQRLEELQA